MSVFIETLQVHLHRNSTGKPSKIFKHTIKMTSSRGFSVLILLFVCGVVIEKGNAYLNCYCVNAAGVRLYRNEDKSDVIGLAYEAYNECYPRVNIWKYGNNNDLIKLRVSGRHPNREVYTSKQYWSYKPWKNC